MNKSNYLTNEKLHHYINILRNAYFQTQFKQYKLKQRKQSKKLDFVHFVNVFRCL
jgi:hypothetical protein